MLMQYGGRNVVIDTTPDFRTQMLRAKVDRLDAVLFTHSHADHIMGLDDVRPFNFRQRTQIPIFAAADTMNAIRRSFHYIFTCEERESGPQLEIRHFERPFVRPFRTGVHAHPAAARAFADLRISLRQRRLSHRPQRHPRGIDGAVERSRRAVSGRVAPQAASHAFDRRAIHSNRRTTHAPRRAFFTHICHDLPHQETENALPANIRLAYDGLEITSRS